MTDIIKILIIEDTKSFSDKMISDLKLMKIEAKVSLATTVESALKIIRNSSIFFDLIICDWNLPDGEGIQVVDYVKNHLKPPATTKILMCTSVNEVENIYKAVKLGANDYMVKPWDIKELEKKVKSLIPNKKN
jgi:DNA-binding response OmpR family regulator